MATNAIDTTDDTAIWERVFRFEKDPTPTAARALLKLQFSNEDRLRMTELAAKARPGTLSPQDEQRIDTYERLGCLLDILHSNARRVLKQRRTAS